MVRPSIYHGLGDVARDAYTGAHVTANTPTADAPTIISDTAQGITDNENAAMPDAATGIDHQETASEVPTRQAAQHISARSPVDDTVDDAISMDSSPPVSTSGHPDTTQPRGKKRTRSPSLPGEVDDLRCTEHREDCKRVKRAYTACVAHQTVLLGRAGREADELRRTREELKVTELQNDDVVGQARRAEDELKAVRGSRHKFKRKLHVARKDLKRSRLQRVAAEFRAMAAKYRMKRAESVIVAVSDDLQNVRVERHAARLETDAARLDINAARSERDAARIERDDARYKLLVAERQGAVSCLVMFIASIMCSGWVGIQVGRELV
ncbi:hypothetical protein LTR56_026905 [Elasticomyces elasticus]|nr:hypothetical protein LTR56_026905 [Elasticomyces elasticus]KAK3616718.1 hypothetical protein LTR22_026976 [Elasticomyces elasticus]KAK4919122.1 hypothetical protein LTR49_013126 [Elasticomyces elasticus]KAK5735144.1 hypothetical protein LTS12_026532 [Elasticomyces elasticus]